MPISTSAGRQPGATDDAVIGCPFGVEGKTVTAFVQLSEALARADPATAPGGTLEMKNGANPSCQPIPLTINGPSRVATASGKLFQTAIKIASLGLSGFKSGKERPAARRN